MKKHLCFLFIIGVMIPTLMIVTGCGPEPETTPEITPIITPAITPFPAIELKPDLVPVNPAGWAGFCDIDDEGYLLVHVRNRGTADAGGFYVKVDFGQPFQVQYRYVQSLTVNETATIPFPMPRGCFNPDCGFVITVDVFDAVDELNEDNNVQMGNCLG